VQNKIILGTIDEKNYLQRTYLKKQNVRVIMPILTKSTFSTQ